MKRQITLCILIFMLSTLLYACAAGVSNYEKDGAVVDTTAVEEASPVDEVRDAGETGTADASEMNTDAENVTEPEGGTVSAGFPPVLYYDSLEEALSDIKVVKAAGPGVKHDYNYDYANIYERDHIYILETVPPQLECKQMSCIEFGPNGVSLRYNDDGYSKNVDFMWYTGTNKEERIKIITENFYAIEQYRDTKFYFGQSCDDVFIHWWEDGDEYCLMYPIDAEIPPEELIDYLEVVRYDF